MAESLLTSGTIKHVVPWKTREEFLSVFEDLYNDDETIQERAIRRIAIWKSRAGNKLSVALESSGALTQARLDHLRTEREGNVLCRDVLLRSCYSLALIRFVNHVTEKGQNKALAQPVHIVAREFGIPEWIVQLRHDATHSALPSLDTLATATQWALNFLKENFWNHQVVDEQDEEKNGEILPKPPKSVSIRRKFYEFQKARYEELNTEDKDKDKSKGINTETLKALAKYITQDRLRFVKCLLEDGILMSTEEQLAAFGVNSEDLLSMLPPTIPQEITEFWRPLLKKVISSGALPFLIQTAMLSVTSGEGIRNYQLVAWIAYFLSQNPSKSVKRKRKRRKDLLFKAAVSIPTKTLLSICLQNVNGLTAHLLKYLADKESLGTDMYNTLMKLLDVHTQIASNDVSSGESDSDTVYTVEDIKQAREKHDTSQEITPNTVHTIQSSIPGNDITWQICTDIVDWANIPLGTLPDLKEDDDNEDEDEENLKEDDMEDSKNKGRNSGLSGSDSDGNYISSRRKSLTKRRKEDNEASDNSGIKGSSSPKWSKLTVTDSRLM